MLILLVVVLLAFTEFLLHVSTLLSTLPIQLYLILAFIRQRCNCSPHFITEEIKAQKTYQWLQEMEDKAIQTYLRQLEKVGGTPKTFA